jgi:hypothetical protein
MAEIEKILGLDDNEINRRIDEEIRRLPTIPGTGYLELRLIKFQTPEWEFLSYLIHNFPKEFIGQLESYADYDGNESRAAIIEGLREKYILVELASRLERIDRND